MGAFLLLAGGAGRRFGFLPMPVVREVTLTRVQADTLGEQLSNSGVSALNALLNVGELSDLRWPDFLHYRTEAKEFYSAFAGSLPWIHDSRPTPQALAI
ncbi:MAG: hypothetical protein ACRD4Y_09195, partial [Candidatus Acidiferrales bacterium]